LALLTLGVVAAEFWVVPLQRLVEQAAVEQGVQIAFSPFLAQSIEAVVAAVVATAALTRKAVMAVLALQFFAI
jgi:hypothetical protein